MSHIKRIQILSVIVTLVGSSFCFSAPKQSEWTTSSMREKWTAVGIIDKEKIEIPLQVELGQEPSQINWVDSAPENSSYSLLTYNAGGAGTQRPVVIQRTIIIQKSNKKVILDEISKVTPATKKISVSTPLWTWTKGQVHISNSETGQDQTIKLKP